MKFNHSAHQTICELLLHEGLWDKWYSKIKNVERLEELNRRNGVDEIILSEHLRDELKAHIPEIGAWKEIIIEFLDNVDVWTFVREIGRHQDLIETL